MLIESSAIYAASSLLFLGFWGSGSHIVEVFSAIHAEVQVRALSPGTRRSSNMVADVMTGHRSIARRSASRQSEGADEQKLCHRECQFDQL